ncbi:acyl carrier protein [Paenibacillus prosopidis]|uniref:Acyl carrier protein n=1 Tax=Paenibacillus prosopidis TaxID=630520 RepID=A0A368VPR7_9BACL|nr:acyl carrier protein [Paenibacillus prosopidis]RCW43494.1 acyl carrier protein [Paenibacillus prosopidis]
MNLQTQIVTMVAEVLKLDSGQAQDLHKDTDLISYDLNSLSAVELIVRLEQHFGIEVDDEDLLIDRLASIAKLEQLVFKYLGTPEGSGAG